MWIYFFMFLALVVGTFIGMGIMIVLFAPPKIKKTVGKVKTALSKEELNSLDLKKFQ